jgi:hypothetical protein
MTPWVKNVELLLIYLFIALSAIAVVATATILAPAHRLRVAWVSFATGATLAAILAIVSTHFLAFVVALLAGLTTAIGAAWLSRRPTERSSGRTTSDAAELDVRRPNGGIR